RLGRVGFRRDSFRGISFSADYSLARNIDDVPSGSFEITPEDVYNRRRDRAVSDLNPGQRLEIATIMRASDLLAPMVSTSPLLSFARAATLESMMSFQSGRYYNVLAGYDIFQDGSPVTGRPGDVGRNTFQGAVLGQVDMRLRWQR